MPTYPPPEDYWKQRQRVLGWRAWTRPIAVALALAIVAAVFCEIARILG